MEAADHMQLTQRIQPALVSLLAFSSLLPLQLLIFGDDALVLQGQLAGIMYTMILIAFFAGAQWNNAITHQKLFVHITSLALAITPWFMILARRRYNEEFLWGIMAAEMSAILIIDWIFFRRHYPAWYFLLRNLTTIFLAVSIVFICLRKASIH